MIKKIVKKWFLEWIKESENEKVKEITEKHLQRMVGEAVGIVFRMANEEEFSRSYSNYIPDKHYFLDRAFAHTVARNIESLIARRISSSCSYEAIKAVTPISKDIEERYQREEFIDEIVRRINRKKVL